MIYAALYILGLTLLIGWPRLLVALLALILGGRE